MLTVLFGTGIGGVVMRSNGQQVETAYVRDHLSKVEHEQATDHALNADILKSLQGIDREISLLTRELVQQDNVKDHKQDKEQDTKGVMP